MKLNKFVTLESGLRPKGGVGGILEGIPSLGGEHLNSDGGFIFNNIKYIPEDFFKVLNKGHIYPNDIILVKDGATTGKTSFVDSNFPHKRAVVNEHLFIVRVDPKVAFPKYVFYYLFSSEGQKQILSDFRGATVGGISRNFPLKVNVPIPAMPEQAQIANFLDQKTGQIDELIRIKERRIELLQEQRIALINQAVTKGLDPNVEMKPSGVAWIGEIPKDWDMRKIKYTQSGLVGGVWGNEPAENENDIYCIRVADFNYEHLTISTHNLTLRNIPLKEMDKRILRTDDLLTEKSGGGEKSPVGKTIIFNAEISRQSVTSNFITKFTAKSDSCFPKYLLYCLCFFYHISLTKKHIKQTTGIQNLDIDSYFQERVPLPSLVEQTQIADFLNHKTGQIDELIAAEQRKIELFKEYRQSLISEAVTGKIDVRNEV